MFIVNTYIIASVIFIVPYILYTYCIGTLRRLIELFCWEIVGRLGPNAILDNLTT